MMNQIIDVEYKEITELQSRSTQELLTEANSLWDQMEAVGNIGLMLAAHAGKRLAIIKERLSHGEWEGWCREHLKFSLKKANRMMKLAEKMEESEGIFSNPSMLTDLGISKVWELLAAPEEVAEEVAERAGDLSVRELKEEIARLKKESEAKNETQKALERNITELEAQLAQMPQDDKRLEDECERLKEKLRREKEKLKNEREKAVKDAEEVATKAKEEGKAEGIKEAEKGIEELKKKYSEAQATIEKLTRAAANNENKELAVFKVKSDQIQEDFNSCLQSIVKINENNTDLGAKAKAALKQILAIMQERI